jgi:hypothetical protein
MGIPIEVNGESYLSFRVPEHGSASFCKDLVGWIKAINTKGISFLIAPGNIVQVVVEEPKVENKVKNKV